ncbi:hypothetical protein LDENG_00287890, partial [Lucifuga dentata]
MSLSEAKKQNLVSPDCADLLLDAQAATGHIIDPKTNDKLTVDEASAKGVIDSSDRDRLLAAEAAAIGYQDPRAAKPLSVFEAIKKGKIDKKTGLRLLQAQESSPECYVDPETEQDITYEALKKRCKLEPQTGLLFLPVSEKRDPSKLTFDGVRKPVTAEELFECRVLDKRTFEQLLKGEKTVPEVSEDKKVYLKGTGPIAGVEAGPKFKMSLSEAKKQKLVSPDSADLLLDAQAATGHIIDPKTNDKLTVDEACAKGIVDSSDRNRLLVAESAAVGYKDPRTAKPLSIFEAMKKGLIERKTGLRLLQAQESVGGILDPMLSVFLPRDTAIKRNLLDENLCRDLNQNPKCYLDPETEHDLLKGEKTVPEVSEDKKVYLKGKGPIAGVEAGPKVKMSLSEAKKQKLVSPESADRLLDAQAATGHIIDPKTNDKLTVDDACAKGVVDGSDRNRLLAAESAAVGYKDPLAANPLSTFEAMKKGLIDRKTGLRLLQAQESVGGILDPKLSVFLPRDTAIKHNLLDENLCRDLNQNPKCYLDPETEHDASYGDLKKRCKTEHHTGLQLLPVSEKLDPSKLIFDGVRKPVTAEELFKCGVLDKETFDQLLKGEKTVPEVSEEKKVYLKGKGPIAGVEAGSKDKMSLSEAKKHKLISQESADLLLDAQAATGHIIDPKTNDKLTVDEACAKGVVESSDRNRLLAAESAAVGYKDPHTAKPLSVSEAIKKGLIDRKEGLRLLQAQDSVGGILHPILSVFLPKDMAVKHNLLDENLCRDLNHNPKCYLDPEAEHDASYADLKKRCKTEDQTGLQLLPVSQKLDPSKLVFDGVRKPVTAEQLFECGVLDKQTFDQLLKGEKTVPEVSEDKKVYLKGKGPIA